MSMQTADKKTISDKILTMAAERGADKTICPSEVARALFVTCWRKHMDDVRCVAIDLQHAGKVTITQKGKAIDTDNFKGPIRIKIA